MPNLLLPIMTGLFLVFAGILIGYFLWFRDRSEEDAQQQDLTQENTRLASEASNLQLRNVELEERHNRQCGQLQILQELCDDLVAGRELQSRERMELEAELRASRRLLDESRQRLSNENQLRCQLEDRFHEAKQESIRSLNSVETTWREKNHALESELVKKAGEIEQLQTSGQRTEGRLVESESRLAQLQSEIDTQREMLDVASKNASGMEREYVTLESSMRNQIELLNESRGQAAAAISAQRLAEESLKDVRARFESQGRELQKIEQQLHETEGTKEKCDALQLALENSQKRLADLTEERDAAMQAESDTLQQLAELRITNEELAANLSRANKLASTLEQEKRNAVAAEKTNNELLNDLQQQCQSQQDRLTELANQQINLTKERDAIQTSHDELVVTISGLRKQNENQESTIRMLREKDSLAAKEISALDEMLKSSESANVENEQRITSLEKTLDQTESDLVNIEKDLGDSEARVLNLEQHFEQLESVSTEYQVRMQHLVEQRDAALSENKSLLEDLERLRVHSKSNEETIRVLRRERGEVLARGRNFLPQGNIVSKPRLFKPELETLNQEYGGTTRLDPVRGIVYVDAPQQTDDLKLISGIAVALEQKLNECGVYTYLQVMQWDKKAIDEFSKLLAFKDRIERDDWQGQARRLYENKYRRAA